MKRLLLLSALALFLHATSWAYDFEVDNIQYTVTSLDDLTAEVSGLSNDSVTEVVIPETIEYKSRTLKVTSIGNSAFNGCSGLTEVTIPNSVTEIGSSAFRSCSGLKSVTIPDGVTEIGGSAFYECTGLTVLTIGEGVTSIGLYAFKDCEGLTEVNFNATACKTVGTYNVTSTKSAFDGCNNISTMDFGDNVTIIPSYICYDLTKLTEVTIPNSVTSIGDYAFRYCSGLKSVTIPNSVTEIGDYAFYYCSGLKSATIGNRVTSIGGRAFESCSSLKELDLPNSVTSIGGYAFYNCTSLTSVTIGNSVTTIGNRAFYNCSSLKGLDIPNSVTSLGDYAFYGCKGLATLEIGAGLKYLYDHRESGSYGSMNGSYRFYYYPVLWSDGPSKMESIVLKDGTSYFSVRGYGYNTGQSSTPKSTTSKLGEPLFSNINVGYYYVGRPLIDVDSWSYTWNGYELKYKISISQPYGTVKTLEIGGYCTEVPYFYQSIEYLILGENVETYNAGNIYQGNLKAIICRSAVPPTLGGTFENSNYVNTIVYVPIGSKAIYEATEGWKDFWDIQELDMQSIPPGYDAVQSALAEKGTPNISVSDGSIVVNGAKGETIHVYNMQGQQIYSGHDSVIPISHHGIYIVNVAGKSKKVSL